MSSGKERVLVVDDSPQNVLVARGHLEAAGYEVLEASRGEEALELLLRESVDLVVLDVLMPGLGGFETCRRIRTTPAIADTAVLFLTALGDREATMPALEAGGDDLLPKPFHRAELILRARALIRHRQTTRKLQHALRVLAEQNETLRRIEHDKRRISQLIVHDLKGPIGAALSNAALLHHQLPSPELSEVASDIVVAMQQLDRTARDLLDLSRAEEGELSPHVEAFSLPELASEVTSAMRGFARWTNVTIELDIRAERITADRELVRRLLQNLVHNAVKHAPPHTAVKVDAVLDEDGLLMRVADSGPGVPPEEIDRIFERFVTFQRAGTDPGAGSSPGIWLPSGGSSPGIRVPSGGSSPGINVTPRAATESGGSSPAIAIGGGHPGEPGASGDASATGRPSFPRAGTDQGRAAGSHGLGLTFCRLAAEAHGGRIWVEPRSPCGAVFCVRIPQPGTPT